MTHNKTIALHVSFFLACAFIYAFAAESVGTFSAHADTGTSTASTSATSTEEATAEPDTVFLQVSKVLSPAHFTGTLTESDFSFHIVGDNGTDETVPHEGVVELPVGTYTITESATDEFDPAMWTVLWAGDLCDGGNIPATDPGTIVVSESDLTKYGSADNPGRCSAENQYKPGRLVVNKEVVGTSTSPDHFSFSINGGAAVAFEDDGSNDVDIPAGDYTVSETSVSGFDVTYSEGCTGTVANTEQQTCTITNTFTDETNGGGGDDGGGDGGGDNGGGGSDHDLYEIFGYVWHDQDEDDEKEESEPYRHSDILITITNGETTATTTTDEDGHYSFAVEAGTWTITQAIEDDWHFTFPNNDTHTHVVTVPDEPELVVSEASLFDHILAFFRGVAHAATFTEYSGPHNFGNNQTSSGGGSSGGDGGGGGSSGSSGGSSGGGSSGGSSSGGKVAGVQTEVLPVGGAYAGRGGAADLLQEHEGFLAKLRTRVGMFLRRIFR